MLITPEQHLQLYDMARNLAVNFKLLTLRRVIVVVNLARAECSPFAAFKNNKINNHYSSPTATSTYLLKCEYFFLWAV